MRRVVLASSALLVVGFAAPSFAAPPPVPVGVDRKPDGSVCVWVSLQVPYCTPPVSVQSPKPLPVPVSVERKSDGSVCVTVSRQLPQCTPPTN